jgi:hypothetical protein
MTRGLGRFMRHNVIALFALFLALGGTSYAAATLISGSQIKPHSIAKNRLTNKAIKQLKGNRGPRGQQGAPDAPGAKGATGAQGPQGPGGATLTYDANASSNTTPTVLGTVLGDTYGATCTTSGGSAQLSVYLKTSDGSWNVDYSYVTDNNGTVASDARKINVPAGTFNAFLPIDFRTANAGGFESNGQLDFVHLAPGAGTIIWHEEAQTLSGQTCHLSVEGYPTTLSGVAGSADAKPTRPHLPLSLTG